MMLTRTISLRWFGAAVLALSAIVLAGCNNVVVSANSGTGFAGVVPSITTQPASQSVVAGGSATFTVVASGTAPLAYQWNKNGAAIPGAQNANYIYGGAQLADNNAQITVTVSNLVGTITSSAATLTVQTAAPVILVQPQPQTVLAGTTATFVVTVSGSPPLSFQWLKNGVAIAGATSASYVTPVTSLADSGSQFEVLISNASGSVMSVPALLTVDSAVVAPSIITQPQNTTAAVGAAATFSVTAGGTQPLSYQWQQDGTGIAGATNSSYTLSPVTAQNNQDSYTVTVSNAGGSVTSQAAVLSVTASTNGISLIAGRLGGAGNLDGSGAAARFYSPETMAVDAAGDVFVADTYNSTVREISAAGVVTTIAGAHDKPGYLDGVGTAALFNYPQGITIDANGNIYVADTGNQVIRMITSAGVVSTFAGTVGVTGSTDGPGTSALFAYSQGLATDTAGDVYVADSGNNTIREITPAGVVSTLAGTAGVTGSNDGTGAAAQFNHPDAVALDATGDVYVADTDNDTIRMITPAAVVTTLAGTPGVAGWADGPGAMALFNGPHGLATDVAGNIFVADSYSDTIRMVTPAGAVTTVAGTAYANGFADGTGAAAQFGMPWGIIADAADNLYVTDFGNDTIRKITPAGAVTTFAGLAPQPGYVDGTAGGAQFNAPQAAVSDASGNMYIADTANNIIRKITPAGVVTTLAGTAGVTGSVDGSGAAAQFNSPRGMGADSLGNIYVADTGNDTIRMITPAGAVTTLAGTAGAAGSGDGIGNGAQFNAPQGLVLDPAGNIYVADTGNDTIREVTSTGVVTTLAGTPGVVGGDDGTGAAVQFNAPQGMAIDSDGNVYIADTGNYTIRALSPAGNVTTFAGTAGLAGNADGTGAAARFDLPTGIAVDSNNNLYVMDSLFRIIREVTPNAVVTTVAGYPSWEGVALGPLPGSFNNPIGIAILPGNGVRLVLPDQGENAVLLVTLP
jgi:sugar lactone lactonase YvrE